MDVTTPPPFLVNTHNSLLTAVTTQIPETWLSCREHSGGHKNSCIPKCVSWYTMRWLQKNEKRRCEIMHTCRHWFKNTDDNDCFSEWDLFIARPALMKAFVFQTTDQKLRVWEINDRLSLMWVKAYARDKSLLFCGNKETRKRYLRVTHQNILFMIAEKRSCQILSFRTNSEMRHR